MRRSKRFWALLALLLIATAIEAASLNIIKVGNDLREYYLQKPGFTTSKLPAILIFHGGGGNAKRMINFAGFDKFISKYQFVAVYPNAINKHWNDGRKSEYFAEQDKKINDVAFINKLIDELVAEHNIDPEMIFAAGISNGGMFSQYLGLKLNKKLKGIATLCSQMPKPVYENAKNIGALDVMMINGIDDPMVPYAGGEVKVELFPRLSRWMKKKAKSRGEVVSTSDTINFWLKANKLDGKPIFSKLKDIDKKDGCKVEKRFWESDGSRVVLITVKGGGHTWPGRAQYLPKRIVGNTCNDFKATEEIVRFFLENKDKEQN